MLFVSFVILYTCVYRERELVVGGGGGLKGTSLMCLLGYVYCTTLYCTCNCKVKLFYEFMRS